MDTSGAVDLELAAAKAAARRAQDLLAATLATLHEGIVIADAEGRFVHFNPAAEAILGLGKVDNPQEEWSEKYGVFFADRVTPVPTKELPLVRGLAGVDVRDQVLFIRNEIVIDGIFISVNARPLRDDGGVLQGAIATFRDVSSSKHLEEARAKNIELELRNRLAGISSALSASTDFDTALDEVLASLFDAVGVSIGALLLFKQDKVVSRAFGGAAEWEQNQLCTFFGDLVELRSLLKPGVPVILPLGGGRLKQAHEALARAGASSTLAVPVSHHGEVLGVLLISFNTAPDTSEDRVAFATGVAAQVALGVTLARAFDTKEQFGDLLLFDSMPQLGWAARPDGYIDYYNRGWYEYTGTTFAEMEGWGWQSVHDPDELPRVMENWTRSIATRQPFEQTLPLRRKDGVFRWFLTRVTPIFDDNGELIRWVGINTDVDDQRRVQEALREAEQRFRLVFEGAPVGMIMMHADGRIALVNAHLETLFGYRREELVGERIEILIPAPFREHHPQHREGFLADPRSRAMGRGRDLSGLRKDGSEVAVEVGLSALKTSEGVFVLGSVVDVSERRRAEAAQRHMAAVVESAEDAIITRGLDGVIRSWNPGATRLLGYRADEMVGLPPAGLIPEDRREEEALVRGQIAAGRRVIHFETVRKRKDESLVDVSATFTPIRDRSGGVVAASIVMRDVTERNQAERERARLVEQLKAVNSDLSELNSALEQRVLDRTADLTATLHEREVLLQEVHHRVKNNLSVIVGLMEMQARLLGQGEGRHALDDCSGRVHAIALIHEKLYQSKNYANIAFGDYLRGLADDIFQATGVSRSSVTLAVAVDAEIVITVEKAVPCGLILNELITNALKYAYPLGSGGTLRIAFQREDEGRLRLAVADDGVGLPSGLNIQETKTLGLRLVGMLAKQLDGELSVKSDRGTLVEVTFPIERAEA